MNVNILGTDYVIEQGKTVFEDDLLENMSGYCDKLGKKIVIGKLRTESGYDADTSIEEKNILRHEIVHAFMYESGLDTSSDWGSDETLVDWIALQFPKMLKSFEEVGAL